MGRKVQEGEGGVLLLSSAKSAGSRAHAAAPSTYLQ